MMTRDELLKRYELTPDGHDTIISYERQLWQARFSPCGKFLIACGFDATIQRWDVTGDEPGPMKPVDGHHGWIQTLDFLPDARRLLTADSWGQLTCWTDIDQEPAPAWTVEEAHTGWIRALAVSPDGNTVATGGNGPVVRLWSTADGRLLQELPHPHRVYSLRFHPQENALVTGDLTGLIRHWDLERGKEVRQFSAEVLFNDEAVTAGRIQQCGGVRVLEFDATGERLVCGGQKDPGGGFAKGTPCAIVFDWSAAEEIRQMPMGGTQDGFCYDARFHPDGFVMATSSGFPGKGHVWFWRPEDDEPFFSSSRLPNGRSLSLHPDGTRIAHLVSDSPNANGRPLQDGEYEGGAAVIRIMQFPAADAVATAQTGTAAHAVGSSSV